MNNMLLILVKHKSLIINAIYKIKKSLSMQINYYINKKTYMRDVLSRILSFDKKKHLKP